MTNRRAALARRELSTLEEARGTLFQARLDVALARLAPNSRRTYGASHTHFARWHARWVDTAPSALRDSYTDVLFLEGNADWRQVVTAMMVAGPLLANTVADAYLSEGCAGLAPATKAVRAAALRWPFRLASELGLISWTLRVRAPTVVAYRDTAGPRPEAVSAILAEARTIGGAIGARDEVITLLLFVLARRRFEVTSPNVGDYDRSGRRLRLASKGRADPEWVALPPTVARAIDRMLELRGSPITGEPLIVSHDRSCREPTRITDDGLYRRLRWLARRAGIQSRITPHALRHSAITAALDSLDGDLRKVAAFARHAKASTTMVYDDRRRDTPGEVACLLAALLEPDAPENTHYQDDSARFRDQCEDAEEVL